MAQTSGSDLRLERLRERITVTALAARMGLSRQTIHTLENSTAVAPDRVQRYRAALFELTRDIRETP